VKHSYTAIIIGGAALTALALVFYGVVGYVGLNTRHVADQINVANYKPTAAITEQIARTKMSPQGKFLYLASRPTVQDTSQFDATCIPITGDKKILGCYVERSKRAYVFRVTDARLDGTEDVQAAHQMLRAAWDRTSPAQQATLTGELNDILASNTDTTLNLKSRVADITLHDHADRDAELYAIVGTEVASVSPDLEKNYAQYFTDRKTVTDLNAHANAYVIALNKKVAALSSTMSGLVTVINSGIDSLNKSSKQLNSDIDAFNKRAETVNGFSSEASFDQARAALISRLDALKKKQKAIKGEIADFKVDLAKLKKLNETSADVFSNLNEDLPELPDIGGNSA
jgi:hypothetical protein